MLLQVSTVIVDMMAEHVLPDRKVTASLRDVDVFFGSCPILNLPLLVHMDISWMDIIEKHD